VAPYFAGVYESFVNACFYFASTVQYTHQRKAPQAASVAGLLKSPGSNAKSTEVCSLAGFCPPNGTEKQPPASRRWPLHLASLSMLNACGRSSLPLCPTNQDARQLPDDHLCATIRTVIVPTIINGAKIMARLLVWICVELAISALMDRNKCAARNQVCGIYVKRNNYNIIHVIAIRGSTGQNL